MLLAVIREIDCVGCGKCLSACPVDAIIGTPKFLHTVLKDECIGCKLCVDPCPVDCIDMIETGIQPASEEKKARAHQAKERHKARLLRVSKKEAAQLEYHAPDKSHKAKIKKEIQEAIRRKEGN